MAIVVNGKKVAGLGLPGKSAYQAAVDGGFTGTEEEFNAALAGMKDGPFLPLAGGIVTGDLEVGGTFGITSKNNTSLYAFILNTSPDNLAGLSISSEQSRLIDFSDGSDTIGLSQEGSTLVFSSDPNAPDPEHVCLRGIASPTETTDAATKGYVDGLVGDINAALDAINGEVV